MDLNASQREAVFTLTGPLLVLAGAGTGKTRVVTCRIAQLIRRGTRAERILGVTFTNKAAQEMHARALELLGRKLKEKPQISTFHSLCVRVLRRHITRLGYPQQFAIYDRGDQESVARAALREIRVGNEQLKPSDLIYHVGRWKTTGIRPESAADTARNDKEHLAAAGYRRYQNALKAAGAVDFDDLLLCTEQLLTQFPDVRQAESRRFDHLLIDEYQDTNGSQYRIVKALAERHRNLCVVGDDDQSIYGWRGAEVSHILSFQHDWPEARVIRLEDNYRSTEEILTVANRLIVCNRTRHEKTLRPARLGGERPRIMQLPDEAGEAKAVVEDIQSRLRSGQVQPRDIAILFRTNEQPRPFEQELRRAKLPYVLVGGLSFYDRKEVRDILSYIKVLVNPTDEVAVLRIINVPARGISQGAVTALTAGAITAGKPLWNTLDDAGGCAGVSPAAAEAVARFQSLIGRYRARLETEPAPAVVSALIHEIKYQDELARQYKEPEEQQARWTAVEDVVNALAAYCKDKRKPSLSGFLDDIALSGREEDQNKEAKLARNAIALMTLHSAKGLEFPEVYLVGMEEGLLPHHRSIAAEGQAIDEERRLCYVGVTRARNRLTLTMSLSRMKWGKSRESHPSRFLFEIAGKADAPAANGRARPPRPKAATARTTAATKRPAAAAAGRRKPAVTSIGIRQARANANKRPS